MKTFTFLLITCLFPVMPGCSSEQLSRTGYETLQNVGRQQCEKDPSANCPERKGYEEYRRQREAETLQQGTR